jgi:hypothetical protein
MALIRTAADAEEAAAEYMRGIGFHDARRTPTGPDGGIDVLASEAVAQVKTHMRPTGRPDLQRLHGAANGRRTTFFSLAGYTEQAVAWAELVDMALFRFDLQGTPSAGNCSGTGAVRAMTRPVASTARR